jgi:hypothetical protein
MHKTRKKTKKPWNPVTTPIPSKVADDLGISDRIKHSKAGFEAEQTGIGHFRLKERSMLTHPNLLAERRNIALRACPDQEKLHIQQTPSDRATAMWRRLLWQFIETHYEVKQGRTGRTNFERASTSTDLNRIPFTDGQLSRRGFYNWLKDQPIGKELADFLSDIAAQCNPQACGPDQRVMSKAEIGAWLLDSDNSRDCKNATDGALALACRLLACAQSHYATQKRYEKYRRT